MNMTYVNANLCTRGHESKNGTLKKYTIGDKFEFYTNLFPPSNSFH